MRIELRKHPDIRFAINKVENIADKVFVLIQVGTTLLEHSTRTQVDRSRLYSVEYL